MFHWRKKIYQKMFNEVSAGDGSKRCPHLQPFEVRTNGFGTKTLVEQECLGNRCKKWDDAEQDCCDVVTVRLMREILQELKRGG